MDLKTRLHEQERIKRTKEYLALNKYLSSMLGTVNGNNQINDEFVSRENYNKLFHCFNVQ